MSNLPEGKLAILLTAEQVQFMIRNCESNEEFAMRQLLQWSTLPPSEVESIRESFLKLDALKNEFRELRLTLEKQINGEA